MALQDLTPQLRTRLNQVERGVGWFVFLAAVLLLVGLGFYIRQQAHDRGWFQIQAKFHTYVQSTTGLKEGDPVYLMGKSVGTVTLVKVMAPNDPHNVLLEFQIQDPYFRYIWQHGSVVIVSSSGFLDTRRLEVTRGTNGYALCVSQPVFDKTIEQVRDLVAKDPGHWQLSQDLFDASSNIVYKAYTFIDAANLAQMANLYTIVNYTNLVRVADLTPPSNTICVYDNTLNRNAIVASWHERPHRYVNFTVDKNSAYLQAVEPVGVGDQVAAVVAQVQHALPNFFALTNQLNRVLNNAGDLTSNLNAAVAAVRPAMTNVVQITALLKEPGGVGLMALGTNGPVQIASALTNVNSLLINTDTNLNTIVLSLDETLNHVADITSNLNAQVQANSNMLSVISKTIGDSDTFIQGLKRHWLLRSAFKTKPTNSVAH